MGEASKSNVSEIGGLGESQIIGGSDVEKKDPHINIPFSKKAIHQRNADENLFLRFLELDPPIDGTAPVIQSTGSDKSSVDCRRKSVYRPVNNPNPGRTPFTITKRLVRNNEKGFGFSIVWTHPPRVEKVELGMSADKAGIVPGDYVIFVDKYNIVTMPEADILNMIQSQGNTLILEIFRRTPGNLKPTDELKAKFNNITDCNQQLWPDCGQHLFQQQEPLPPPSIKQSSELSAPRPSTACSNASYTMEQTKRRLHLPQVTFCKESNIPHHIADAPRRFLYQLISREQHFVSALQFGMQRFVAALQERKDLISPNDHRTLFQNIEEILRLSEDVLEQIIPGHDQEPQLCFTSRVYMSKSTAFCAAYKKYCNGIKRADCVLVNKSRQSTSEFVNFITQPQVPRKRPDLTTFIHKPLQHFREVLKLILIITSHCRISSEEHKNFSSVIKDFQAAYRDITVGEGLMEPLGEGKPLLTLQDLESRLVFTKCKPFVLTVPGRQWIFGGDLSRVEGRTIRPYWTLLFSDILLFAKVSRDRVLFITEEPLSIINVVDSDFNVRKKSSEFRLAIDPNGKFADSPTTHCTPDLSRTPKKNLKRRTLILRAPSCELKAVWQNLLQRQIFLVNAALGSAVSSPLESPDILQSFVPLSDIGAATTSMASVKLSSADSMNLKNQQASSNNSKIPKQLEDIIDEKCRFLNKTGTSRGSAFHLAQWMKGQLDNSIQNLLESQQLERQYKDENEDDENNIEEWTKDQLISRTKELQLLTENTLKNSTNVQSRLHQIDERVEEIQLSDADDDSKSTTRSTTSDSQITVRTSPIANDVDKIYVCRHCHNHCKNKLKHQLKNVKSLKNRQCQSPPNSCCATLKTAINSSPLNQNHPTPLSSISKISVSLLKSTDSKISSTSKDEPEKLRHVRCHCEFKASDCHEDKQEIVKETCRLLNSVTELNQSSLISRNNSHDNVDYNSNNKCGHNDPDILISSVELQETNHVSLTSDDTSKCNTKVDPFEAIPNISIFPPTPEGKLTKLESPIIWDNLKTTNVAFDASPEDSPQDEELPYRTLTTKLKRYGTMSSLERLPSEEAEDKTYLSSSDENENVNGHKDDMEDLSGEIKIVTKQIYTSNMMQTSQRTWSNRAGTFLEQSRAFFDSYLGRWDRSDEQNKIDLGEDTLDECTSGATSGDDVWGTPTSGENDEIQMLNSDQTSSSSKSSSALTGDDDTDLMMDELLMAPPMTASTIRGLLPRRRLEPLFEEDTESCDSDEEKLPPDCSSSDQGQVQTICAENGLDSVPHPSVVIRAVSDQNRNEPLITATATNGTAPFEPVKVQLKDSGTSADTCCAPAPPSTTERNGYPEYAEHAGEPAAAPGQVNVSRLSPRLEMRLALNNDIMGDEDLINYAPGPDLTAILGHDLSTYHRFTGRDLLSRSGNRIAPTDGLFYSQQKNSKADTPTPNRKKPNPNTWNNSVYAGLGIEKNEQFSDLELLARQEKKYCMSQLKSGQVEVRFINRTKKWDHDASSSKIKLFDFLKRPNSDNQISKVISRDSLQTNGSDSSDQLYLERKNTDKSMDRRFWKQLTKRRRSLSVSEIAAS